MLKSMYLTWLRHAYSGQHYYSVSTTILSALLERISYAAADSLDEGFTLYHADDAYLTFAQVEPKYTHRDYHRCGVGLNHLALKVKGRETVNTLRQYCKETNIPCLYEDWYN